MFGNSGYVEMNKRKEFQGINHVKAFVNKCSATLKMKKLGKDTFERKWEHLMASVCSKIELMRIKSQIVYDLIRYRDITKKIKHINALLLMSNLFYASLQAV